MVGNSGKRVIHAIFGNGVKSGAAQGWKRRAWEADFVRFRFLEVEQKEIGYLGLQRDKNLTESLHSCCSLLAFYKSFI